MRRVTFILMAICLLLLASCTTFQTTSVCDDITSGDSVLCDMATKQGVSLESIGHGLIVVNAVAITGGLYTKAEAVEVLGILRESLDRPITYMVFKVLLEEYTTKYSELLDILQIYLDQLDLDTLISDTDKDILRSWLDARILALK